MDRPKPRFGSMPTAFTAIRQVVSQMKLRVDAAQRRWVLARALRWLASKEAGGRLSGTTLKRLTYGWGNESWSAGTAYLQAIARYVEMTDGAIVECGSGLSTLVAGTVAPRDRKLLALEHDQAWARRVESKVRHLQLTNVEVALCKIRSYGAFEWYGVETLELPSPIGLVICDGPPGRTRGGRFGAIPVLQDQFAPGCVVLVDDMIRAAEQQVTSTWCRDFGLQRIEDGGSYAAYTHPENRRAPTLESVLVRERDTE